MTSESLIEVPLYEIAHGRTGDKGDRLNCSIIPFDASGYDVIAAQATETRMKALFAHRGCTSVKRYDLPKLKAFNFVFESVLQGGVNNSLNLDGHGKALSFLALTLPVKVPRPVLEAARAARDA